MTPNRLDDDERALLDCYLELKDHWTPKERFDLGCYVSSRFLQPGQSRDREKLGQFCGVSRQAIEHIELRGLRKCRRGKLLMVAVEMFGLNGSNGSHV